MSRFLFAGDSVESGLDLPLLATDDRSAPEVTVTVVSSADLTVPDMGAILHRGDLDGAPWAMGELDDGTGWGFVFGHGCIGRMTSDRSGIELTAHPSAPHEWLGEVVTGWALVYRLAAGGRSTFHASTMTLDGRSAVAVAGPGHSGKSTMAAATVALGGALLGDDVMAAQLVGEEVVVRSTASTLKLRGAARDLRDRLGDPGRSTFDHRLAIRSGSTVEQATLSALFFLDRDAAPGTSTLEPNDVVVRLIDNSKVGAWVWDAARDSEFDAACELADRVPGFVLGRGDEAASADELLAVAASMFRR